MPPAINKFLLIYGPENMYGNNMPEVPVNPSVLKWARELRGLSLADAAHLLGITETELRAYESGKKLPLVTFLRNMSDRYRLNFASLLMPEPLPKEKPLTDFRIKTGPKRPLSIETLVAIEEVKESLDAFADISEASPEIIPKPIIGKAERKNPEAVAIAERQNFGISPEEQSRWASTAKARIEWRQIIESRGIFTYMISMPIHECSGFSIFRNGLAAICINDNQTTEGAKIFTLFHEYGHLLLRQAGLSDENQQNRIESFCNQFAASFLIPKLALRSAVTNFQEQRDYSDAEIGQLARKFRVSNRAIALRLEETGLAPTGFYARRTGPWDVRAERRKMPTDKEIRIDPIRRRLKRVGNLHAETALNAVVKHAINPFDASQLVGVSQANILRMLAVR